MCSFGVSIDKRLWEEGQEEFQEQLLTKRIREAAVCLKLLAEEEPLPNGIALERYENSSFIGFCVSFPSELPKDMPIAARLY